MTQLLDQEILDHINKHYKQKEMETIYKVSDIKKLIQESSQEFKEKLDSNQEFKAKLGDNVEKEEKKINDEAYEESEKRAKEYNGKFKAPEKAKYEKVDGNKTLTDVRLDFEPSKDFKEKVEVQGQGYTSKAEKENGIEKAGAEFNDAAFKGIKKAGQKMHDNEDNFAHLGIWGHNMPKDMIGYPDLYENKNVKTIYFKKTTFLTEGHMISRIPDEFKNEGSVFKMKDKTGNSYLVEWSDNKANIIGHENKQGLEESVERMKKLMGYKPEEYFATSTSSQRLNENEETFQKQLNNIRKLMK